MLNTWCKHVANISDYINDGAQYFNQIFNCVTNATPGDPESQQLFFRTAHQDPLGVTTHNR